MKPRKLVLALLIVWLAGVSLNAQTYSVLYTYPGTDRNNSGILAPQVMSQGQDGALYSTVYSDGTANAGSAYKITTAGARTTFYNFCAQLSCTDGSFPQGGLILGTDGNFWGTTSTGGSKNEGTIFKLSSGGTLTSLYSFMAGTDGGYPTFTLIQGIDANFYGESNAVYNGQYGAVFRVSPAGKVTVPLADFNFTDGAVPSLFTQGTDGNFYGVAELGGSKNLGVVYKMTPAGKISVLHNFTGYPSDGALPYGILTQGNDGNFYGVTYEGGTLNQGTIFKISSTGTYSLLYSFSYANGNYDGYHPVAGLTLGTDGNFYGVTESGGTDNAGAIIKFVPSGTESVLYSFCPKNVCNGFYPVTPLVQHTNGKFYGNTAGNSLGGSVFYSFDLGLGAFAKLVNWSGSVGATVQILGQGFTGTTKVSFNGVSATFRIVSDTYITASVPSGATTGYVSVQTPGGTLKSNRKFLVAPANLTFSPTSGPVGTVVTITGTSLTGANRVTFGGVPATTFTVDSDTQITATVPTGAVTGKISVTTAGGTATSADTFTVTQ